MKTLLFALITCSALAIGCKGDASCEKVTDHILSLMPDELEGKMGDKKTMIARCQEQPIEVRECALAAESFEAVVACGKKK